MAKHMLSKRAICPYYRHEDPQVIYCDGVVDESVIHLAFSSKITAREYKESYCRCRYADCKIERMLEEMMEDDT